MAVEGWYDMISGISHMTFIVKDLDRAALFWRIVFEANEIYSSGDKIFSLSREKYFTVQGLWICIMQGNPLTERTYNHIAFKVSEDEIDIYADRIKSVGAESRPERPRINGEGRSIYFYDFDNHLFELHSGTLAERIACYNQG